MFEEWDHQISKFFPFEEFRPYQKEAIKFVYNSLLNRRIGLLSSPCGTGKSISVLTAFFAARQLGYIGRLLVLTRTKNQLEIYCRELKRIKEYSKSPFRVAIFKSKQEMCALSKRDKKIGETDYEDFIHYCKTLKQGEFGRKCEFYENTYFHAPWKPSYHSNLVVRRICEMGPLLPDEVYDICLEEDLCPYEITKILSRYAEIIVGNYNYLLIEPVRKALFGIAKIRLSDVNCIFDEAHSLPIYASDLYSDEVSTISLNKANEEAEEFNINHSRIFEIVARNFEEVGMNVYKHYGLDFEKLIKRERIIDPILKELKLSLEELLDLLLKLSKDGELIRLNRTQSGERPISYVGRCADFLFEFIEATGLQYVRYVKAVKIRGRVYPKLGIKCIDPSIATSVINRTRSSILMSGTLWNMEYYIDILNLDKERIDQLELPSPFPSSNRLILVDRSVTTKYEKRGEAQWEMISHHLKEIIDAIDGRIAIYFPSYEVMDAVLKKLNLSYPCFVEDADTKIKDLLEFLMSHDRCVVFGVARGKISEGIDVAIEGKSMLSAVILVGLPYPKKTELHDAITSFYREKFGRKAFEYANDVPCITALAQSAGRLLRSPNDRGIIIIMDSRMLGKIRKKLPKDWRDEMKFSIKIEKLVEKIKKFENLHK